MKWNYIGKIIEFYIDKSNLCSNTDNSVSVFFPSISKGRVNLIRLGKSLD